MNILKMTDKEIHDFVDEIFATHSSEELINSFIRSGFSDDLHSMLDECYNSNYVYDFSIKFVEEKILEEIKMYDDDAKQKPKHKIAFWSNKNLINYDMEGAA